MTQQYQYQLARRGKWICPECGRKTFVCYVDADGHVLDESVGKCDRADHCAHHYTPRQYFEDHQAIGIAKPRRRSSRPMFQATPRPTYIDTDIFKRSVTATMSHRNNLVDYLKTVFDVEIVNRMISDYSIGTSRHWQGATVFWQVDQFRKVRRGKIMQYNAINGKRVKEPFAHVTSVHKVMNLGDNQPQQCLFGLRLLEQYPGVTVGVVESEKTAIILSGVLGDCIPLACGGCGMLTAAMCEPLRGRDVVLFPDNGKFQEWSEKGKQMRHLFGRLRVADIMEREAINPGDDIADLIVQRYAEWCAAYPGQVVPINLGLTEL